MNKVIFVVVDFDNIDCPVQGTFDSYDKAKTFVDGNYGESEPVEIQEFKLQ